MSRNPRKPCALLLITIAMIACVQLPTCSACPFASAKGMVQAMPHLRKILATGGAPSPAEDTLPQARPQASQGDLLPPPGCKQQYKTFAKCDDLAGYGPYSPTFYEDKGCTGGRGLWGTIVKALESFDHPHYGTSFVSDCLAPMVRNVFHMDISLGHNARLFLEDFGSKAKPQCKPDRNITTSRSAKLAIPNLTLRCFDIYEHLRVAVDKYTAKHCSDVYVSCTDLANYAAKYAHWKLSDGKFLPCYNFGFADAEPEDFAADPFHKNLSPREAAFTCLPPHDSGDIFHDLPLEEALSKDKFDIFFNAAMQTFSKPCYPTPVPMNNEDLASILLGHTVGEGHCFLIQLLVKEPFMNNEFFQKLASDCTKCRDAVAAGTPINPYGDFQSNLNPALNYSFAQKCKTAGQQEYLPAGKTTGINRVEAFLPRFGGVADPCCVPNDVFTKDTFDFQYFPQVSHGYGLFEVDNGLAVHKTTKELTGTYAQCSNTHKMFADYQRAWNKMNLIGGKPYDGKRRQYCSVPTWAKKD